MTGKILHLQLKTRHGGPMKPVDSALAVTGKGLQGDAAFGHAKRQVLIIENETLQEFDLPIGDVRENLTVAGVQLAGVPAGTRVRVGVVLLEATLDCAPCEFIEDKRPGLRAAIEGRRGTLFRVVEGGEIKAGDPIAVLVSEAVT
ncbi:MAG: MOSC domain-containing protein [Chloroflexi bacterium]|nr:MOSC domain-containing protein [Chloroflexota bacterium]